MAMESQPKPPSFPVSSSSGINSNGHVESLLRLRPPNSNSQKPLDSENHLKPVPARLESDTSSVLSRFGFSPIFFFSLPLCGQINLIATANVVDEVLPSRRMPLLLLVRSTTPAESGGGGCFPPWTTRAASPILTPNHSIATFGVSLRYSGSGCSSWF